MLFRERVVSRTNHSQLNDKQISINFNNLYFNIN